MAKALLSDRAQLQSSHGLSLMVLGSSWDPCRHSASLHHPEGLPEATRVVTFRRPGSMQQRPPHLCPLPCGIPLAAALHLVIPGVALLLPLPAA